MTQQKQPAQAKQSQQFDSKTLLLEAFFPYRLVQLANQVSLALAGEYSEGFNLSIAEWRIMANLGRFEPLSAMALAEKGSLDKARVTRALASMQQAELIHRATDEHDQRIAILSLSEKGRRIYQQIAPLALNWENEFLSVLNIEEINLLDRILDKLSAKIKAMAEDR